MLPKCVYYNNFIYGKIIHQPEKNDIFLVFVFVRVCSFSGRLYTLSWGCLIGNNTQKKNLNRNGIELL